ncbi:carbohydrate-binding module family 1 protein [Lentithecium fluviatile CBS 122367]|uniref:AA9 family lytic polysaccharide monooxygenase n=1 Tax=Lentithecium fluviatile CBS 122367 TaxID=1168545 RepID=A0A6G1J2L1_9PLEO|nr:carbohydrate-binding module family 1 protein [Lentithecium fluviatile CBS 122367]
MKFTTVAAAASLLVTASAHGGVGTYIVGSTSYPGWSPYNSASGQSTIQRQYPSFDPLLIKDLTTTNIRCNNPGVLGTGPIGSIAAGDKLKVHWVQWTHRPAAVMVYMAKCPSSGCNSWDGAGKVWFKIDEQGLVSGTQNAGKWAGDTILDTLNWTSTIPASLTPGEYLIRHELLALHQANNPQFYPECAQFKVSGSGAVNPPSSALVSFPGAYSATDPGIAFNIDSEAAKVATTYPVPGPPVWDGTSNSQPTNPDPTTTTVPTATPTTLVTTKTPTPTSTCSSKKYQQCGGKGFTGCTVSEAFTAVFLLYIV